jgi:hypothetical protein
VSCLDHNELAKVSGHYKVWGECLNELVIVEIRTIAIFQKFLFSCCKIEFFQCGKNPWGLQSLSSPQEPEPEEYEVVLYIGAAPIYIYTTGQGQWARGIGKAVIRNPRRHMLI